METRLYSIEQRLDNIESEHSTRLKEIEARLSEINESIKALIVIGKTLRWVALFFGAVYLLVKTGEADTLLGMFK